MTVKNIITCLFVLLFAGMGAPAVFAGEKFTEQTGQECAYCHAGDMEDYTFTPEGDAFVANYYKWPLPDKDAETLKGMAKRIFRKLLGGVHALSAFAFVGGIIFAGLFTSTDIRKEDPSAAELRVRWLSLLVAATSGVLLIPFMWGVEEFWSSTLGIYLVVKIVLFNLILLLNAYLVSTVSVRISALRREVGGIDTAADFSAFTVFTPSDLKRFTGGKGSRALVAYKDKVYDVTMSEHWDKGMHFFRHRAGNDLTREIKMAPHKPTVLDSFKVVGTFNPDAEGTGAPLLEEFENLVGRYELLTKLNLALASAVAVVVGVWHF